MRAKIFEWIERRFGDLGSQGVINYAETATIKISPDQLKKVETRQIILAIVLKETDEKLTKDELHYIWKKELEGLFGLMPEDKFVFAVDWNLQNRTPSDINILDGAKREKLARNTTVKLTVNVNKKINL